MALYQLYKNGQWIKEQEGSKMTVDGMGTRIFDAEGDVVFHSPGYEYSVIKGPKPAEPATPEE